MKRRRTAKRNPPPRRGGIATDTWSGDWAYGFKDEEGDAVHAESTVVKEGGVWKVEQLW